MPAAEQKTAELAKSRQGGDSRDVALGWAGLAAVQVAEGKWKEAKESIERGECRTIIIIIKLLYNVGPAYYRNFVYGGRGGATNLFMLYCSC